MNAAVAYVKEEAVSGRLLDQSYLNGGNPFAPQAVLDRVR